MGDPLAPDRDRILSLLRDEQVRQGEVIEDMRETLNEHAGAIQAVHQTLHGPEGSNNGLYRTVMGLNTKLDDLLKFKDEALRDAKQVAKEEAEEAEKRAQERSDKAAKKAEFWRVISISVSIVALLITIYVTFGR